MLSWKHACAYLGVYWSAVSHAQGGGPSADPSPVLNAPFASARLKRTQRLVRCVIPDTSGVKQLEYHAVMLTMEN